MYIKMVNSDEFNKPVKVVVSDVKVAGIAKLVTITGDITDAHTPNVNTKQKEVIVPVESAVTFENGQAVINLPANSVVAVILDLV